MAWEASQYVIDEILNKNMEKLSSGIPPRNIEELEISYNSENSGPIIIGKFPNDTIIDGQLICTVAGIRIMRRSDVPPTGPHDPYSTLFADIKVNETRSFELFDNDKLDKYYYHFYPYSDHKVFNYDDVNAREFNPTVPSS